MPTARPHFSSLLSSQHNYVQCKPTLNSATNLRQNLCLPVKMVLSRYNFRLSTYLCVFRLNAKIPLATNYEPPFFLGYKIH